ncbi:L,D-transpeptidase [Jiangella gansuensis]|uniref:L,D-transpeptidase n=1 Tax=Jiangella gansuensis TaxID=281473 RepID=UPI0004ACB202|nr:L,D-transpeptidase [Jiangella gansuensis]
MSGRYGVSSRAGHRHAARRSRRLRGLRVTAFSGSTLLVAGLFGLAGTATAPEAPVETGALPLADRVGDDVSRGDRDTVPAKLMRSAFVKVTTRPAPTEEPAPDPNAKPAATAPLPAGSGSGHRVVFDITGQQVWLVDESDTVVRTYMVSGSRFDQLPTGTFEVFSASRNTVSWHGTETMEYMVRFFRGENSNIGFHDIPVDTASGNEVQTLSQLGTPLSDGCIRQDLEDAVALWEHAPVGTPIVVVRT